MQQESKIPTREDRIRIQEFAPTSLVELPCPWVPYQVQLSYFRQTGKLLALAELLSSREELAETWADVNDLRRLGRLPHLRPGTGRDLFVIIDVPDHPQRELHMVMPPLLDEDDVTPARMMAGEPTLLVRVPLVEGSQTTTRDIIKPDKDDTL